MGLDKTLASLEAKRRLFSDQTGLAPFIAGVIILLVVGAIGVSAIAVWQITQRPDITYNITDTGFSLAGLDMGSIWPIVAIAGGLIVLWLFMRKK
jgi:nitric oxide reductase large subunit